MLKLLLQTTIEGEADDWNVERFSRLRSFLSNLKTPEGEPAFQVVARNRTKRGEPDPVLSTLDESDFDQLWLLAVDVGDGLTSEEPGGGFRTRRGRRAGDRAVDLSSLRRLQLGPVSGLPLIRERTRKRWNGAIP